MDRPVSYYVQSKYACKIPFEMELLYVSFKNKLSELKAQHSKRNDIETQARMKALAFAAYDHFRIETAGYEEQIFETIRLSRNDLLSAAQCHLDGFATDLDVVANEKYERPLKLRKMESSSAHEIKRIVSTAPAVGGIRAVEFMTVNNFMESESDYISSINAEADGVRKAENVLLDLNIETLNGLTVKEKLKCSNVCIVDVGASVGSNCIELALKLDSKNYCHGIIIEYMAEACKQAVEYAHAKNLDVTLVPCDGMSHEANAEAQALIRAREELREISSFKSLGHIYIFQGDVTINLPAIRSKLSELHQRGDIDCVLVTCHAVLHELPTRSANFSFERLLNELIVNTGVEKWVMYAREPSFPEDVNWTPGKDVYLQIPGWHPQQLKDLAQLLSERLPGLAGRSESMRLLQHDELTDLSSQCDTYGLASARKATCVLEVARQAGADRAEARGSSSVLRLDALLAMELLFKTLFYVGSQHLIYEIGEQLTSFESQSFMKLLQLHCKADGVQKSRYTSGTFKEFWNVWHPKIWNEKGERMREVPVPSTLIVGWRGLN